jgi:hypothetical protein
MAEEKKTTEGTPVVQQEDTPVVQRVETPAVQPEMNNSTARIERLLIEQAKHNKQMLILSRVRTVATVAIAVVILVVVLVTVNLVNSVADDLQGVISVVSQLGDAGALLADLGSLDLSLLDNLGSLDLSMLEGVIEKIDGLDFDSLEENMQILGDGLRALQDQLDGFRLF